ncbi:hypothetical protein MiAbB_01900 [Microcystis aeruginosa NIES-4285]|uniref:Uncharacterized protein n=1 Tax=Microcystis aeruginosa NIES-4285 TaxID=2497681 RepID=A0A402DCR4_MICAE|nr:hypothetical protein MiAbB_01900 [Microcystis aeruginosa NIES-4285]
MIKYAVVRARLLSPFGTRRELLSNAELLAEARILAPENENFRLHHLR